METCLPGDDLDVQNPYPSSLGIVSNLVMSSSMSSLSVGSVHSPTDKDSVSELNVTAASSVSACGSGTRMRPASTLVQVKHRIGSLKRRNSHKKTPPDPPSE